MIRVIGGALALLLAASVTSAATDVTFQSPLSSEGLTVANGIDWLIIYGHGSLNGLLEDGSAVLFQDDLGVSISSAVFSSDGPTATPRSSYSINMDGVLDAQTLPGQESYLLIADAIINVTSTGAGRTTTTGASEDWRAPFDGKADGYGKTRQAERTPENSVAFAFDHAKQVQIEVGPNSVIESFGWYAECNGHQCAGAGRTTHFQSEGPGHSATVHADKWGVWSAKGGEITVKGDFVAFAFSPTTRIEHNGTLRFPSVQFEQQCPESTCATALNVEGGVVLDNLRPGPGGSMTAELDNNPGLLARLDETYVDPATIFGPAAIAGTSAAVALLALLGKFALGLFTKIKPDEALQHPRRKRLMEYIKEKPGATFRELLRATDIPAGTARHHLTVMRRSGLIMERHHRSTLRFFENHGKYDHNWGAVVLLREEPLAKLHAWITDNPHCKQGDILDAMIDEGAWTRSTTQHRLQRLIQGGMVSVRPQGRLKIYTANETPQAPPIQDPWTGLGDRTAYA